MSDYLKAWRKEHAKILELDRTLVNYGPETREIRGDLQRFLRDKIAKAWPEVKRKLPAADIPGKILDVEAIQREVRNLAPASDLQRAARQNPRTAREITRKIRGPVSR